MNDKTCCQQLPRQAPCPNPFSRMIALGFYDGPTSGLIQCSSCARAYHFDMLDWDEDHEVRVFRLALLPNETFENYVNSLAGVEAPRWPVWVPFARTPSPAARATAERKINQLEALAKPADLLVAWQGCGESILAAAHVDAALLADVPDWFSREEGTPGVDWFSLVNLEKVRTH